MQKTIDDHLSWIDDPYIKAPSDADPRQIDALVKYKWPSDIARIKDQMGILQGILGEKSK